MAASTPEDYAIIVDTYADRLASALRFDDPIRKPCIPLRPGSSARFTPQPSPADSTTTIRRLCRFGPRRPFTALDRARRRLSRERGEVVAHPNFADALYRLARSLRRRGLDVVYETPKEDRLRKLYAEVMVEAGYRPSDDTEPGKETWKPAGR